MGSESSTGFPAAPSSTYAEWIVASLGEGVVAFDADHRVQVVNPAFVGLLGRRVEKASRPEDFLDPGGELYQAVSQALTGSRVVNRDLRYKTPAGKIHWLRIDAATLCDEAGRVQGFMLTAREVSELKRAEREIWQVEKMTALGRLASSVAHEVGNPLSAIDIQLQLLQEDIAAIGNELAQRVNRRVNIARTEMRRLDGIVQNFLRFSRPPALHLKRMSPNDLLRHIFALVEPEARDHGIALVLELDDSLPAIEVDENQLSQALLNILINAFQAVPDHSRIVLRSTQDEDEIILQISDNGHGISEEDLERIFEFYYTTKEEGTGLGLSIAQRIVHQHGGTVTIESQKGEGTQVYVRLPGPPR
jgi:two-component system, sporulation sensor kinase E